MPAIDILLVQPVDRDLSHPHLLDRRRPYFLTVQGLSLPQLAYDLY